MAEERPSRRENLSARPGSATPQQEAVMSILRSADVLRRYFADLFEPHGLTLQQYNVLRILRGARPETLPTMEIAERMLEKTPGITGLIDRLEGKGLVASERMADDRRCIRCSITARGLELLAQLDDTVAAADAEAMTGVSEEDARHLVATLEAIRDR
jgi:DNA-binding MarR family transcriptional regulator